MKTRIIYLCLLVILSTTGCIPTQTIKGDGNIITENIPVSEYDCLELEGGGMVVNYTQSDAPEGLEIKTDRNIFEKYEFNVEDHKLKIRPKKEFRKHTNFRPTEFMVTANSRNLKKLAAAGSTHVNINSPLQAEEFEAGFRNRKTSCNGCEKRNAFFLSKTKCASNLIRKATVHLQNQSKTPSFH